MKYVCKDCKVLRKEDEIITGVSEIENKVFYQCYICYDIQHKEEKRT